MIRTWTCAFEGGCMRRHVPALVGIVMVAGTLVVAQQPPPTASGHPDP